MPSNLEMISEDIEEIRFQVTEIRNGLHMLASQGGIITEQRLEFIKGHGIEIEKVFASILNKLDRAKRNSESINSDFKKFVDFFGTTWDAESFKKRITDL